MMRWKKVRDVKPDELHMRLAIPRPLRHGTCPNTEADGNRCGFPLSDVAGIEGGPVCIFCGVQFKLAESSDMLQ